MDCTGQNLRIYDKGLLQIQQGHLRIGTQELPNLWSALTSFIRNTRAGRLPVGDALTLFNYNEEEPLTIRKVAYSGEACAMLGVHRQQPQQKKKKTQRKIHTGRGRLAHGNCKRPHKEQACATDGRDLKPTES